MIVTSFSETGYEEYGRRFIGGFLQHWKDEKLTVYVEGENLAKMVEKEFDDPRVGVVDLLEFEEFVKFADLLGKSDPLFQGLMRGNNGEKAYNFRYDANKFFRKVFAITAFADSYQVEVEDGSIAPLKPIAWLDADTVFTRTLPEGFLKDILAGHEMAYLGRSNLYSETGFMAWEPNATHFGAFMRVYRDIYLTGAFTLLAEWHDCQVVDFVRKVLEYDARNLAKGCDPQHPFVYSVLGTYMDHLKGPDRKKAGASRERIASA